MMMKFELKPNIASYVMGIFLIILGMFWTGWIGILLVWTGVAMIVPALCMLPLSFVFIRLGLTMITNRIQVFSDEIVIREFLAKDIHISISDITSYENIEAPGSARYREYHRMVKILCSEAENDFKYTKGMVTGENELMVFLDKCVRLPDVETNVRFT